MLCTALHDDDGNDDDGVAVVSMPSLTQIPFGFQYTAKNMHLCGEIMQTS